MKKKFSIQDFKSMVDFTEYEPLTPMQAIKAHCKECYCWEVKEMKKCESTTCPFHQFLVNGFKIKRNLSEEVKQKRRENMLKHRRP